MSQTGEASSSAEALVSDAKTGLADMDAALDGAVDAINGALADSAGDYEAAATAIENAFATVDEHVSTTCTQLRSASSKIAGQAADARAVQKKIAALEDKVDSLPISDAAKAELIQQIDIVANTVGNVANQQELLAQHLSDAADSLERVPPTLASSRSRQGKPRFCQKRHLIDQGFLQGDARAGDRVARRCVESVAKSSEDMASSLSTTASDLSTASKDLSSDLSDAQGVLTSAATT